MDRILMNYYFKTELVKNYKSNVQKIRVMSENWVTHDENGTIIGMALLPIFKISSEVGG